MTDWDADRERTLHGEPVPLPSHYPEFGQPGRPPKGPSWLLAVIAAVTVLVIGLGGLLVWMLVRDGGRESAAPASQASTTAPGTAPQTVTVVPPVTVTAAQTPAATPPADAVTWYAQFGAFNDYGNAQAEAARHYRGVVLPGARLGLPTSYVVVRPADSQAAAVAVCAEFADGACYVRSGR